MFGKKDRPKNDKKGGNIYTFWIVGIGAVLFAVILFIVLSSTRSITAIVPNQSIAPGTTITPNMLKAIEIPANTPSGYITDENSLIGQKIKIQVDEDQMLYSTNVQTSFNMFGNNVEIPENYILTNINIPDSNAVSGLISAGDNVDIAGIPTSNYLNASVEDMEKNLGGISENKFGANGINGYWILGNVKILQSFKSQVEQANVTSGETETTETGTGVEQGSYIVALSYADYKKILIAQQYLDLYMNVGPRSGFDIELMKEGDNLNPLIDAQDQNPDTEETTEEEATEDPAVEESQEESESLEETEESEATE